MDHAAIGVRSREHDTCQIYRMTTIVGIVPSPRSIALPVVAVDRKSRKPMYKQLYEGYREAIVERRLSGGQRLPSTRSLAAELRISRIPVLNAFEQLLAEGYFESRPGAGTFVARALPEALSRPSRPPGPGTPSSPAPPGQRILARRSQEFLADEPGTWLAGIEPFHCPSPPLDLFPNKIWSSLVTRHSRRFDAGRPASNDPMGLPILRETIAEYLRTARAVRCEAQQIMVVSGSQQALDLTGRVLLEDGSPVWVEEPGYFGTHRALTMAGARLVGVPVDDEGLDVEAGLALCPRPRAVYVTPSHQLPLGVTMSASRRLRLLEMARRRSAWIVEDDYDGEYRYGNLPIASLQGLDRDARVLYLGTFTKSLFPALRVGYMVLPSDLVAPFAAVRRSMDMYSPLFLQEVLADFILEGHFDRHLRKTRSVCRERRSVLVDAIESELGSRVRIVGDQAGMFLTLVLPTGYRDRDVVLRAAQEGVRTFPLSSCYLGRARLEGLVLGYGGFGPAQIVAAVRRLRKVLVSMAPVPRIRGKGALTPIAAAAARR
jgi:GntR family transcriptional regulator / MocR family aminotransferase